MALNNIHIKSNRGGARAGAGRPAGTKNKLSGQSILDEVEQHLGRPYAEQLVSNYVDAINANDTNLRFQYDKLFLSKVVADKADISITESEDAIEAKRIAFADAIQAMAAKAQNNETK